MITTSTRMNRRTIACLLLSAITTLVLLSSCKKNDSPHPTPVSVYSADVLEKWMVMQIRLMKNTTGVPNQAFGRHFAYSGAAALESLSPGLPTSYKLTNKWNGLAGLPASNGHGASYYYPANVNAAMAEINRKFFPNANAVDKAAIDSLENALTQEFLATQSAQKVTKSAEFGKAVATAIFNWSETDGYKNANAPYVIPTGPGLWEQTSAALPSTPYFGNNRTVITGSISNVQVPAPLPYSTEANSPFYHMAKQVYDVSKTLTDEQKRIAEFWRDVPGVTSPGHWLSILHFASRRTNNSLDKAALAYAVTGAGINDALIACWKSKYQYNLLRPVTYIRKVIGDGEWNSFIATPPHPEYISAHSSLSAAAAAALEKVYGNIGTITDRTYEYMGYPARTYSSFTDIAEEAGLSRLFAGIHYMPSIDMGLTVGKKVTANIFK